MRVGGHDKRSAAFFDVDGTLLPPPSLERRLFAELRRQHAIPLKNYFALLSRALSLAPQGLAMLCHTNKFYLRGLRCDAVLRVAQRKLQSECIHFFGGAIDTMAWHAAQGHAIVLMSGTLAPLARIVAAMLAVRLAVRGTTGSIEVRATELEEVHSRWTGQIVGDAMFGAAKRRAIDQFAHDHGCDPEQCYAYADSWSDRWMLEAVGRPVAVNPSRSLGGMARAKGWSVVRWTLQSGSLQPDQQGQNMQEGSKQTWEHLG